MDSSFAENISLRLEAAGDLCSGLIAAFRVIMADQHLDEASKALVLSLPSASELISLIPSCDPCVLHHACEFLIATLARELRPEFEEIISRFSATSTCVSFY